MRARRERVENVKRNYGDRYHRGHADIGEKDETDEKKRRHGRKRRDRCESKDREKNGDIKDSRRKEEKEIK